MGRGKGQFLVLLGWEEGKRGLNTVRIDTGDGLQANISHPEHPSCQDSDCQPPWGHPLAGVDPGPSRVRVSMPYPCFGIPC